MERRQKDWMAFKQLALNEVTSSSAFKWIARKTSRVEGDSITMRPRAIGAPQEFRHTVHVGANSINNVLLPIATPVVRPPAGAAVKELLDTEMRYHEDLCIARDLFHRKLEKVLDTATLKSIFLNLTELIDLSAHLMKRLKIEPPGTVFSSEINRLSAFVTFCSQQEAAQQKLEVVLQRPEVHRVHKKCCKKQSARGLPLSHYLLLPLGRVTRYPLLFDKMFSACLPGSQLHASFDVANQLLKSLVLEVNLAIHERDNRQMLRWSQLHVKCDERIEFASRTVTQGAREFLHSGLLYDANSGEQFVGILYNDFLLLSTPDGKLEEDGFKITASTESTLRLFKNVPLSIIEIALPPNEIDDDFAFMLRVGIDTIHLRAVDRNARTLWLRQLEAAIDNTLIAMSELYSR